MPVLPLSVQEKDQFVQNSRITQLMEGRSNATGTVTLTTGATSTTVAAPTCAAGSIVKLAPQTLNAAGAVATTYVKAADVTARQFIVTHASSSTTDRTFGWTCFG